ncbi:MAG: SH3 domain-containing protein, partial [Candidatus Parcubacteria bacterium]|nr:SH3 domain-containing protein [Candidatus Parcubacteria bacterium]
MKKFVILFFALGILIPFISQAGCCGCDPVYSYDAKGEVISAVWVRDQACTATGAIIDTLKAGQVVKITDKTDGWYKVISPAGKVGWSGETFFTITDKALTSLTSTTPTTPTTTIPSVTNPTFSSSSLAWLKGYILLQVQANGEAWYVDPVTFKRYYMKDGAAAYEMMRSFGLGITDADLYKIPDAEDTMMLKSSSSVCSTNSLANRLKGRILLEVQRNGEAFYVYPKNCRRIYMKDGATAYTMMRFLGLGITNVDLSKLSSSELTLKPVTTSNTSNTTTADVSIPVNNTINETFSAAGFISTGSSVAGDGSFQKGSVPSGFNYKIVTQHILDRINYERTKRGHAAIVSDQRMIDTASVWAEQMYNQGQITHTR